MAIGNTFNKRLSGNTLKKATEITDETLKVGQDASYVQFGGVLTSGDGISIIMPDIHVKIRKRCLIEINPLLFQFGPCNYPTIVEPDIDVGLVVYGEVTELPEWTFRLYVLRS